MSSISELDAQMENLLESRVEQIDAHWRQSGSEKPGAQPKSGAMAKSRMAKRPKAAAKAHSKAKAVAGQFDALSALDAQMEDLLENRVKQIDAHWRQSGGEKPGAQPKSGAMAKSRAARRYRADRKAAAKAQAPLPTAKTADGGAAALAAASSIPKAAALGVAAKPPPARKPAWVLGATAKAAARALGARAKAAGAFVKAPPVPPHLAPPLDASAGPPAKAVGTEQVKFAPKASIAKAPAPKAPARAAPPEGDGAEGADEEGEDEDDYDPFAEAPAPHVAADAERERSEAVSKNIGDESAPSLAAQLAAGEQLLAYNAKVLEVTQTQLDAELEAGQALLRENNKRLAQLHAAALNRALGRGKTGKPPWRRGGPPKSKEAASWLRRGGRSARGPDERMDAGAELAKEYFASKLAEEPAAKRAKVEATEVAATTRFAQELMEKAPASIQTCRSLLIFLDKKLSAPIVEAPAVDGPADLRSRLAAYAEGAGRLDALRAGGWDARAKRVLDVPGGLATATGKAALQAAQDQLESTGSELEASLKERGEGSLDASTKARREWAQGHLRRDWLSWCARLLRCREAALVAAAESGATDSQIEGTGLAGVVQALLSGAPAGVA